MKRSYRSGSGESAFVRGGSANPDSLWGFSNNDLAGFVRVNSLDPCPGTVIRRGNTGTNRGNCR